MSGTPPAASTLALSSRVTAGALAAARAAPLLAPLLRWLAAAAGFVSKARSLGSSLAPIQGPPPPLGPPRAHC